MPDYLKLKKSNCQNCYKCIRHCPVKSIRFQSSQAHIVKTSAFSAVSALSYVRRTQRIRNDVPIAEMFVKGECPVAVSLAPSFVANYPGVPSNDACGAQKLGFDRVEETAVGASVVKTEYERSLRASAERHHFHMLSLCQYACAEVLPGGSAVPCTCFVADAGAL